MEIIAGSLVQLSVEDRIKLTTMYHFLETISPYENGIENVERREALLLTKSLLTMLISGESNNL